MTTLPSSLRSGTLPPPARPDAPVLLVHGGAWAIPSHETAAHEDGLRHALARGQALLRDGAAALEVVTETVAVMERHGAFDAGCGAVLTRDGTVELDAGVMDGPTLDFGAVACVRRLATPIRVARDLLVRGEGEVRLLVGTGAEAFAEAGGVELVDNRSLIHAREQQRFEALRAEAGYHTSHPFLAPRGTVGCVARDRSGRLAAATSTGGTPFRPSGRVGDTPLPGCGFYAGRQAAASSTGWGEAIAAVLLAGRAVDAVASGTTPEQAARAGLAALHSRITNRDGDGATGGLLLLSATGEGGWAFTTPRMARGAWHGGGDVWIDV